MAQNRQSFESENRFLLATIGRAIPSRPDPGGHGDLDWDYVLAAARQQGIAPLLARWVEAHAGAVPPRVSQELWASYWTGHFQNRILARQLERILAAAARAGIPLMPLKGAALISWYYPAPGLRPMSDLDFLCRPGDEGRVAHLLETLGFTLTPHPPWAFFDAAEGDTGQEHAFVATVEGTQVLVECRMEAFDPNPARLLGGDRGMMAALNAHNAGIWDRARCATVGDAVCTRIAPEDLLLHVASHMATRHAGLRLLWLHDVRVVLDAHSTSLDWEYVTAAARTLHLTSPVRAVLMAARDLLGAAVPERALAAPRERRRGYHRWWDAAGQRHFRQRARALERGNLTADPKMDWWVIAAFGRYSTAREGLRAFARVLVPPRPYMAAWSATERLSTRQYRRAVCARALYLLMEAIGNGAARLHLAGIASFMTRGTHHVRSWPVAVPSRAEAGTPHQPSSRTVASGDSSGRGRRSSTHR